MQGSQVGAQIKQHVHRLEAEHERLRQQMTASQDLVARLTRAREDSFVNLATEYLPELGDESATNLREHFPHLQRKVDQIVQEKRQHRERLDGEIARLQQSRRDLEPEFEAVTQAIESKAAQRDTLQARVHEELQRQARHAPLVQEAAYAKELVLQTRRRAEAAERERSEKAPEYEDDALFRYLAQRKFGTPDYHGRSVTATLDAWVAGVSDYKAQHRNYRLLHDVVDVVAKELARHEALLEQRATELRGLEKDVEDRCGLTRAIEEGEQLYKQRVALVSRIEQTDAALQQLTQDRRALDDRRGRYYERALQEYKAFLEGQDVRSLHGLAQSTPSDRDDQLTGRIADVEGELEAARRSLLQAQQQQNRLADGLGGLRKIESTFYRQGYDASNSRFERGLDIDALLQGFVLGGYSLAAVMHALTKHQRFDAHYAPRRNDVVSDILVTLGHVAASQGARHGGFRIGGGGHGGGFRGFGGGGSRTTGGFGGGSRTTGGFG